MDSDINLKYKELLENRDEILDNILKNFTLHDETEIYKIVDLNTSELQKLRLVENEMRNIAKVEHFDNEETIKKYNIIVKKQFHLIKALKLKKKDNIKNITQLQKKNDVMNNYVTKKTKSIFVDKDFN
ncbi:MAG: hypothetical protein ACOWWH_08255 [Eubacteriaceae bacterium]